jgi:hypothetical protein
MRDEEEEPCWSSFFLFIHPSSLIPSFRGRNALRKLKRHSAVESHLPDCFSYAGHVDCSSICSERELASCAPGLKGTRSFENQLMYFALMIVIALAAAALVLVLEHRGQATLLEREDRSRAKISDNTPTK